MTNLRDPPDAAREIVENDHSYLDDLDLRKWLVELERLAKLLYLAEHPLASKALPPQDEDSKWKVSNYDSKWHVARIGIRTVRLLERTEHDAQLSPLELPALRVHLDAPDGVIMEQFADALRKARERYPAPVANTGKNALKARFTEKMCRVWRENRIVQLCKLLVWRKGLNEDEAEKYPNWMLGEWLKFDAKKTSLAIDRLESALASIPALAAQVDDEATKQNQKED